MRKIKTFTLAFYAALLIVTASAPNLYGSEMTFYGMGGKGEADSLDSDKKFFGMGGKESSSFELPVFGMGSKER